MTRLTPIASVALVLGFAAGCSSETGILVEIEREAGAPGEIDTLVVYAGVRNVERADVHNFRDVEGDREASVDVGGRDLAAEPYRLLLRRGEELPDRGIMVAAIGLSGGAGGTPVAFGSLTEPVTFTPGRVVKWKVVLGPLPADWQVTAEGCLIWSDGEHTYEIGRPGDLDCDGDPDGEDCAPQDPAVHHGQIENCDNGIDDNCDGNDAEQVDEDGDGFLTCTETEADCDDTRMEVNPGAVEVCDGLDNDCSGRCDDRFDADGDEFTTCGTRILGETCEDGFWADCDEDPARHPGVEEQCDAVDHDCDGSCINGFDDDGDGWAGDCPVFEGSDLKCAEGESVDCDDEDMAVHPGQSEKCDGKGDTDCDGEPMPAEADCYASSNDAEMTCYLGERPCDDSEGGAGWLGACVPNVSDENVAPESLCLAYESCESAPDPLGCTYDTAQVQHAVCEVTYAAAAPGALCGQPLDYPLPTNGLQAECEWRLIGGTNQAHYRAGFTSETGATPTASRASCDGAFTIAEPRDSPPEDDDLVFWVQSANGLAIYRALLRPSEANGCADLAATCLSNAF